MKKLLFALMFFVLALNAGQISFKDQDGNTVKLNEPAKRVAMFPIPLASFSMAVDNGNSRLVNINPVAKRA